MRDELKALCRSLGLDDSGREKQVLIDRRLAGRDTDASGTLRRNNLYGRESICGCAIAQLAFPNQLRSPHCAVRHPGKAVAPNALDTR